MGNYFEDIVSEADPATRKKNLDALIAAREPTEILVLTILSVVHDDEVIRRTALGRLDARDKAEGDVKSRVSSLIRSWRDEGAILTWPEPMEGIQTERASRIEAACRRGSLLVAAAPDASSGLQRPWWKFW